MNNAPLWFMAAAAWWFVAAEKSKDLYMSSIDNFMARFFVILSMLFLITGFRVWMS